VHRYAQQRIANGSTESSIENKVGDEAASGGLAKSTKCVCFWALK